MLSPADGAPLDDRNGCELDERIFIAYFFPPPQIEISCDIPKDELNLPLFSPFTSSSVFLIWLYGEVLAAGTGESLTLWSSLEAVTLLQDGLEGRTDTVAAAAITQVGGDGRTHYGENQLLAAADCLSCLMEYCWYAVDVACCAISIGFAC